MSLLSLAFALFSLVAVIGFQLAPVRLRPQVLLAASYVFYASHGLSYAVLLLALTIAVHRAALALERHRGEERELRIVAGFVSALILILLAFKVAGAVSSWSIAAHDPADRDLALQVLVPLGLSYFVFKLLSYLLDVHWEKMPAEPSLVRLALYASFFPHVVSGPIQRADDFFEGLDRIDRLDLDQASAGLRRILVGLFKKLAIADRIASVVNAVHAKPSDYSSLELLLGAYAFAVQLYMDFSGVTDIAIGLGMLFGIKGPENFDLPFFSRNLQEYWRRWHMSLTSWLADYVFTPLRMALRDRGRLGLAIAILVNMVAIGIWHGLAWTYAAFGLFHGIAMIVSVLTLKSRDTFFRRHPALAGVRAWAAPLVTFHLVVTALVVFRATSIASVVDYFSHLVRIAPSEVPAARLDCKLLGTTPKALAACLLLFGATEAATWAARRRHLLARFLATGPIPRWIFYYGLIVVTLSMSRLGEDQFIYAQF